MCIKFLLRAKSKAHFLVNNIFYILFFAIGYILGTKFPISYLIEIIKSNFNI